MKNHSHPKETKVSLRILAILLANVATINTSTIAAEQGRVETNHGRRISRPSTSVNQPTNLSGIAETEPPKQFSLQTDEQSVTLTPSVDLSDWNPWQKIETPRRSLITQTVATPAAVQIDYEEIERAYMEAIPPTPGRTGSIADNRSQFNTPLLCPSAHGAMPVSAVRDYWLSNAGTHCTDVDMCACGTAIPSGACMQSRQIGLYCNRPGGASSQIQTRPGAGNVFYGTAVPGGNAAAAARMPIPASRFASPFARLR